ncbi:hypothetical protein [Bordetella sp. FB-8]|uniref:hypothetical protein n=1 Tax=Bordetella sp. FB-8 TaxID=1159870 RepID=UPI00035D75E8|nr:hypothetical protein [Bordetella sp. FB-8]
MPKSDSNKVAAITITFWIVKTAVTTVGDLAGDALSIALGLGYVPALVIALVITAALFLGQLHLERHRPVLYWALVLSTAASGAEISDSIDRFLHFGTAAGAGIFLVCLLVTQALWRVRCGRIGFYPISRRTDEVFYWMSAILANCLGSVLGDLFGDKWGFGTAGSVAINIAVLALLALVNGKTRISKSSLFWTAFVFTRIPL